MRVLVNYAPDLSKNEFPLAYLFLVITCEAPNLPPGSFVVGYDYNVHSTIEYHCDAGHLLRGEAILKCMDSGEWSGDAPVCEYIDCGPLQPLSYGTTKYLQNTTFVGSEAVYSCLNSHRLQGATKRRCLENGSWSDEAPKCEEIRCTEPVIAAHSILSVTGNDRMYGRTLIRTAENNQKKNVQTYKLIKTCNHLFSAFIFFCNSLGSVH